MRKIAVYDNFTEPKHRRMIDDTAARYGFAVDYYEAPQTVPPEKRGEYEVIYGMPKPSELKDFVNLKWFCGSFAGVDAYLDEGLYPSPEVMLSNSSGAYGVTIAEHLIMVTLMLLRHEVTYCADAAAQRWGKVLPMRGRSSAAPSPCWARGTSGRSLRAGPRPWEPRAFGACGGRKGPQTRRLTPSTPTRSWTGCCRTRIFW